MTNRVSSGAKLLAGAIALVVLGVGINFAVSRLKGTVTPAVGTETVNTLPRPEDRLLAFSSDQNGHYDIYTMHVDGSGLTNLTNNPAQDANPFWSQDGKRIAFESDRDGTTQIYVMDADGSNLFQVTSGQTEHRLQNSNPWSPDGSRLLFTEETSGKEAGMLYTIGVDGQGKTLIAQVPDVHTAASWSPDGRHIAFIVPEQVKDHTVSRIHVVDTHGGNPTNATKLLPADEDLIYQYSWSPDGGSLFFLASRWVWDSSAGTSSKYAAYQASLDGETLTEKATSSTSMASWWDGTAFVTGSLSTLTWLHADGTYKTFNPLTNCPSTENPAVGFSERQSTHGTLLFSVNCSNDELWVYWANAAGTVVKQLLDFPIPAKDGGVNDFIWSPDDKYVAVIIVSSGATHLYVIDVNASLNDPSLKPFQVALPGDGAEFSLSWQPIP